jgi:hypothetical protein
MNVTLNVTLAEHDCLLGRTFRGIAGVPARGRPHSTSAGVWTERHPLAELTDGHREGPFRRGGAFMWGLAMRVGYGASLTVDCYASTVAPGR